MLRWFSCTRCKCCVSREETGSKYDLVNQEYKTDTAESGEEAKMEPTCETQTEQPSSVMNQLDQLTLDQQPADELSTEQVLADQPPPQQEPDPRRLPEASSLVVTATEGSSVDEPPLVELSASSDLGDTSTADPETKVKAEIGSKSSKDKVNRLENLAQQIESFDPVAVFSSSKDPVSSAPDHKEKVEESALFLKDINDETLIDEIVQDIVNVTDSDFVDQKSATVLEDESKNSGINDNSLADNTVKDNLPNTDTSPHESDKTIISDRSVERVGKVDNNQVAGKDYTSDKTSEGNISNNSETDHEVSVSTAEVIGNDLEGAANGTMTVSTESEGFNEEQNQAEPTETEGETPVIEQAKVKKETIPAGKKTEAVKSESPTKKSKRKEDKSIEHILKALSSLQTTEEKLAALCKKYADLHEEHRVLQTSFKQSQRKLAVVSREKDQLQTEHTKAVMAKSKLESLCRELQKHNQTIRQESIQRAKEEDEKRKEISQKFQTTISEIQQQMQENHDRNKQLREENYELANKLKKFIEQYEAREKQVEKVIQHRELEQKLADAKLEQASAILMEEKGKNQKEKELLLHQSTEFMKKLQLKDHELQLYKERYEEFQSTISKSEEMFQKFKTEMEKMTKRTKKLEKDGAAWKVKWENANRALLEMADEKTRYDKEKSVLLSKINKLESLCRAMQAERQARKMLSADGVDMSDLEKVTNLIPAEVRQNPTGGESPNVLVNSEPVKKPPSPAMDIPDVEPGPSEPSEICVENDNNSSEGSEDSGDTEQTGTTVIPKDPNLEPDNKEPSQSENTDDVNNQSKSPESGEITENQTDQSHHSADQSTEQVSEPSTNSETVTGNQSAS